VRIDRDIVPPAQSFKYLGVTLSSKGHLAIHEQAVFSKAKVAGYEVAKLMKRLQIRDISRLRSYMQCFVDSQFYGIELFPLKTAQNIDAARKVFLCTYFSLPRSTANNLVYAIFPVMPAVYLLLKRRASFYERALVHDLECVREAFLFDMCQLYPNDASWTFQLIAEIFHDIGIDIRNDISSFPRHLREFNDMMTDPELICFHCIRLSEEKTLSFFRFFPDVLTACSFRDFLSTLRPAEQDFLLLFVTSGLRWRFFISSARGSTCPCCCAHYWSWEHVFSCPMVPVRSSAAELIAMIVLSSWAEVCGAIKRTTLTWLSRFPDSELSLHGSDLFLLFPTSPGSDLP
jgi:hypothetical protein